MRTNKWQKIIVSFWLIAILGVWWLVKTQNINFAEVLTTYFNFLTQNPLGLIIMLLLFMLRPLLLLPSTVLIAMMGFLYGIFLGLIYGQIFIVASSSLAYIIGRYFGKDNNWVAKNQLFDTQIFDTMRKNSFESVLLSRLLFLPGDLVNYGAGFFKVSYLGFLGGTLLGGLPGMLMVILAGAAIEGEFNAGKLVIHKGYLLISTAILLLSLALSWWLRTRQKRSSS